ncbi:MAG: TonB-dependent receptor [Acidobacteria bacterium]|nr:TonB-dependent receptor [Acidobacteriota bacterium]
MILRNACNKSKNPRIHVLGILFVFSLLAGTVWAQVTASITGTVKDASGAVVPEATVTIKNLESGLTRTAETDDRGSYSVPALPVGQYEVVAEKAGFKRQVRRGITLVVAQQAVLNLMLEIGGVEQQVTVTAAAPLVNTTLSSTSGLVGEQQVKDLPLNGRSFDQLLTLNTGTVNYTSNTRTSTIQGNSFSVAGRRPEENRFLMNGVDYVGTNAQSSQTQPGGSSGQLLGVDAVREFNVLQHTYGAEYGRRAGGQVTIVTMSGTNQVHGTVFEYLRNNVLDARNFFDRGPAPPFRRNQFGGSLGGPLKQDKLFLFGNYEGFRQRLGLSNVAVVPDAQARQGFLPIGPDNSVVQVPNLKTGMLPFLSFWPEPNGPPLGGGVAYHYANPPQKARQDFGVVRFDYNVSTKDSFSVNYLIDDGENLRPEPSSIWISATPQRKMVLGLQETRIFSPALLNVATVGFTRAIGLLQTSAAVPIPANLSFVTGFAPGSFAIGGTGGASGVTITPAGGTGLQSGTVRNYFTWADDVHLVKGKHSVSAGLWIQRIQQQNIKAAGQSGAGGQVTYPTLLALLQDLPTEIRVVPNPSVLGFRSTQAAWYVQDEIKLKPNLTLRLGLRDEMTTGYNEAKGRCANIAFDANGIILTDPLVSPSCLSQNNAIALWQPRVGVAWDPTGTGMWAVRAGFGIYNNLQDNLAIRLAGNAPFNARVTLRGPLLSNIPIPGGTQPPPSCNAQLQAANQPCSILQPAGIEPTMHTPTIQQWSFTVERAIMSNLMLQLNYVGSQAYHLPASLDANTIRPQVCANPEGCASGGTRGALGRVPQGTTYVPPGTRPNPFVANTAQTWWYVNNSSHHGLGISLVKRASHGLTFKTNYTFSKTLDLNSATGSVLGVNEPQYIVNRYDLNYQKGIAAFNLKHQFNANFSYELPFGRGQRWGSGANGFVNQVIGGWQWNGILTAQSGFPFTPVVGSNISGTGDPSGSDVPNWNPAFSGPVILGTVKRWYDPTAFLPPTAGTFGNVSRGALNGQRLTNFDTSLFKRFSLNERWSLQFRAEVFNLLNHANFTTPNAVNFSGNNINPAAGIITSTATDSRQFQFALKLTF